MPASQGGRQSSAQYAAAAETGTTISQETTALIAAEAEISGHAIAALGVRCRSAADKGRAAGARRSKSSKQQQSREHRCGLAVENTSDGFDHPFCWRCAFDRVRTSDLRP